jgi:uncharacterized membrane protein
MMLLSTSGAWGYGWWWVGGAFMVVWMAMMLMMSHGSHGSRWFPWCGMGEPHEHSRRPEQTLADRVARGEIDIDEYERRLAALPESSDTGKA